MYACVRASLNEPFMLSKQNFLKFMLHLLVAIQGLLRTI